MTTNEEVELVPTEILLFDGTMKTIEGSWTIIDKNNNVVNLVREAK